MKIEVSKHDIFTDYMWSFMMPDHEHWKKQLEDIVTVEKNKDVHKFSMENICYNNLSFLVKIFF